MGDFNNLFIFKSLLTMPSNVLPQHLKQTFPAHNLNITEDEGDGIKSRLLFKILSTLRCFESNYWIQNWLFTFDKQDKFHNSMAKKAN